MLEKNLKSNALIYELYNTKNDQDLLDIIDTPSFIEPNIILLALNGIDPKHFQFLETKKTISILQHIPVIVLVTNHDQSVVHKAYELGANTVFEKEKFQNSGLELTETIINYWYRIAYLPK
ncbi:MAG: hypothetical protein AAF228_12465 [Pseudomonadota bacterium]